MATDRIHSVLSPDGTEIAGHVRGVGTSRRCRPRWSTWDGAFLAGKAFIAYRKRKGSRTAPLPDFYIGAHAAVRSYRLLTRDPRRYRTYFLTVSLVAAPDSAAS